MGADTAVVRFLCRSRGVRPTMESLTQIASFLALALIISSPKPAAGQSGTPIPCNGKRGEAPRYLAFDPLAQLKQLALKISLYASSFFKFINVTWKLAS